MRNSISKSVLATIPLVMMGMVTNPNPVNASTISTGSINFILSEALQFSNNAIDLNFLETDFVPGSLEEGGSFTVTFAEGDFLDLVPTFQGAAGVAPDLFTPSFAIPTFNDAGEGAFLDDIFYDLVEISDANGLPGVVDVEEGFRGIPLLHFDLDGDGDFEDDAIYYQTGFIRTTTPLPPEIGGGFDTTLNFEGFFAAPNEETGELFDGLFESFFSEISLVNGAVDEDPSDLGVIVGPGVPADLSDELDESEIEVTNFDGVITAESVPEPGSIVGLSVFLGFFGLLKKKHNKAK